MKQKKKKKKKLEEKRDSTPGRLVGPPLLAGGINTEG
jgi:hypothetical protein